MKIGIIGAGMIVHDFLTFAHTVEGLEIVAISATSREEEKLQALAKEHNIPYVYTNAEELLANSEVEVAYVAVPNHLHFEFTKKAILAGKDVICEKPFTSNLRELETLQQLAKENGRIILEAVSTNYLPNVLKIKEELSSLGAIKIVTMNYSQYSSRYNAFKAGDIMPAFNPQMSGGALMDLNIYNINFVVNLFGKPEKINYLANVTKGIDTSGILTLDYGDFKCVCIAAKDCKAPISTNIQGDEGCINVTTPSNSVSNYSVLMNDASTSKHMSADGANIYDYNEGKHRMYHEFVEFVEIIKTRDMEKVEEMMEISLITMGIQTEARKQSGVVFPADQN